MDQPGKVANPARGQLNRAKIIPLSPCVPENLVSRDGFSRPVPRQPAHLHTQAESGAYLRDSSRVPRRRPFMKPPYAIGSKSPEFIGSRNCVSMAFYVPLIDWLKSHVSWCQKSSPWSQGRKTLFGRKEHIIPGTTYSLFKEKVAMVQKILGKNTHDQ